MSRFLEKETFKTIIDNTPLISIDFIVKHDEKILLGFRKNKPAFGYYFTLGGRVYKNETLIDAKQRILKDELGITTDYTQLTTHFLGVFEHFYDDSIFDDISTHYVNHGYLLQLDKELINLPQEQHSEYKWFTIKELLQSDEVHDYVKLYFKTV